MALSKQHRRFVHEYLISLNATDAYRRAGYKARGNAAEVSACQLLRNPKVAAAIAKADEARITTLGITAGRVLQELARIAFVDVRKLFDDAGHLKAPGTLDDDTAAALASIDVVDLWGSEGEDRVVIGQLKKLKLWSKVESLTLLGKHLKLFVDRVEHGGVDGKPIEILYGTSSKKSLL